MGIKAQWIKPYTITTRDSDFSEELHNILNEKFHPERPNAVWCTDITYIWTWDGFVYLTSIKDLYSRKIIAWTLSQTMEVSCVIDTIEKAKARRKADRAVRGDADGFCGSFQQLQRFHPRFRIHFQNVINHHLELSQTDTTWRALAAAL